MLRSIPIGGPLPDVADHVVKAIAVRWKSADRRRALVAVVFQIFVREFALPGIGHVFAVRREFIAPGKLGTLEAAARGELPFGFRRQFLSGPLRVSFGIFVRDVDDGMIFASLDPAAAAIRMPPVGAKPKFPPSAPIASDRPAFRED